MPNLEGLFSNFCKGQDNRLAHPAALLPDEGSDSLLGEECEAAGHHVSQVLHTGLPAVLAQPAAVDNKFTIYIYPVKASSKV